MKVILFGASGMVGQGVLRECLLDSRVTEILSIGRSPAADPPQVDPTQLPKLYHLQLPENYDFAPLADKLSGYDACFFCLGISSAGMSESDYRRITYDLTLAAAQTLARLNPAMTFTYVSGAGTDSTERGRTMWARVKGATENALLRLPFRGAYMFRPGFIQPLHGIQSKTRSYRIIYATTAPIFPLLRRLFPRSTTDTAQIGRAMLHVATEGYEKHILEASDINRLAKP